MKVLQVTAKSVEKAIEQGLKELGKSQEEVDIKILEEGGFFKKAKIELIYEGEDEMKAEVKEEESLAENKKETKKQEKIAKKQEKTEEKQQKEQKIEKNSENKEEKSLVEVMENFLKGLFEKMNVKAEISFVEDENGYTFNATGEDVSSLIGKRGETLNSIQDLMSQLAKKNGFRGKKVYFDVENYKNRREMSLISLAEKMAEKAKKIGKPVRLERLNAYERKIVHTAIQSIEGVSTHSEGEEPHRYLIIIPE